MQTRAAQVLAKAFQVRGAQRDMAKRTGIRQSVLSRLAKGEFLPKTENSQKLKNDPIVPIDPDWWFEVVDEAKGAA